MRPIRFDPLVDLTSADDRKWWADWSAKAHAATELAIQEWEQWLDSNSTVPFKHAFNDQIWGNLKRFLLPRVFFDKCAYCESPLDVTDAGDAEHFRPKGKVTIKGVDGKKSVVTIPVGKPGGALPAKREHPGYFWLAYDWRNLLPACRYCNSVNGKTDQFPVSQTHQLMVELNGIVPGVCVPSAKWPGAGYPLTELLDIEEKPYLLTPVNPKKGLDPREHLAFGVRGIVTHVEGSKLGEETIRILDLDRDGLDRARAKAQELAWSRFVRGFSQPAPKDECLRKGREEIKDYIEGRAEYSIAALSAVADGFGPID